MIELSNPHYSLACLCWTSLPSIPPSNCFQPSVCTKESYCCCCSFSGEILPSDRFPGICSVYTLTLTQTLLQFCSCSLGGRSWGTSFLSSGLLTPFSCHHCNLAPLLFPQSLGFSNLSCIVFPPSSYEYIVYRTKHKFLRLQSPIHSSSYHNPTPQLESSSDFHIAFCCCSNGHLSFLYIWMYVCVCMCVCIYGCPYKVRTGHWIPWD